jgi:hypothetical protein
VHRESSETLEQVGIKSVSTKRMARGERPDEFVFESSETLERVSRNRIAKDESSFDYVTPPSETLEQVGIKSVSTTQIAKGESSTAVEQQGGVEGGRVKEGEAVQRNPKVPICETKEAGKEILESDVSPIPETAPTDSLDSKTRTAKRPLIQELAPVSSTLPSPAAALPTSTPTPLSTNTVAVPPVPSTMFEFERDFKTLRKDSASLFAYFKVTFAPFFTLMGFFL